MTSLWAAITLKRRFGHQNQLYFLNPECIRIPWVLGPKKFPVENFRVRSDFRKFSIFHEFPFRIGKKIRPPIKGTLGQGENRVFSLINGNGEGSWIVTPWLKSVKILFHAVKLFINLMTLFWSLYIRKVRLLCKECTVQPKSCMHWYKEMDLGRLAPVKMLF